jgi:hypothetical protein
MSALAPSSLDSTVLAVRLRELAGEERNVQVDFLLHLDEFDRRRAFVEAGHTSLWSYCLEVLHMREGAAGRRIQAMRVLRRFPRLEVALRDGRLCLSTIALLGQVLTEENLEDLLARAAYRTKAEVDHLVASAQARTAPRAGVRRLPEREPGMTSAPLPLAPAEARPEAVDEPVHAPAPAASIVDRAAASGLPSPESAACGQPKRPPEMRAVSESQWSLRVTIGRACNEDLETLKSLLAHKIPGGDLAAVLHEAIRCGIEKHGKRKGAVAPAEGEPGCAGRGAHDGDGHHPGGGAAGGVEARRRALLLRRRGRAPLQQPVEARDRPHPPAGAGRIVEDGRRTPAVAPTTCFYAERAFGREHMDRFRRERGESGPSSPDAGAPTAEGAGMRGSRNSDVVAYPSG